MKNYAMHASKCAQQNSVFSTRTLLLLASIMSISTIGCGGSGQDKGSTVSTTEFTFSGAAVDPHLARATIYVDTNENGTRDPWENFAFTDDDGYYSFNPITHTDYCAATATKSQKEFCLTSSWGVYISSAFDTQLVLRVHGGYDILTGEPFKGQLSRKISLTSSTASVPFAVITPITSLLTHAASTAEETTILNALNLNKSDIDIDYVNKSEAVDTKLLNTSLLIHKTVSVLADRLNDTYTKIGDDFGTPNDASAIVYKELAAELKKGSSTLTQSINPTTITEILDNSEEKIRTIYKDNKYDLPSDMGNASTPNQFTRITDTVVKLPALVDALVPPNSSGLMEEDVTGNVKALEAVVIKTFNEKTPDTSIDNAITFFSNTENTSLINTLTTNLGSTDGNITALIHNDFNSGDLDSSDKIIQLVKNPETVTPITAPIGLKLKVSDPDLGSAPNLLKDKEVEFYFLGEDLLVRGNFVACAKYIDKANINGTLGKGNTRGQLIKGNWSLLGATANNVQSYSVLLTLEFLGAKYAAVLKPDENIVVDNSTLKQYRFDNNGEFTVWRSTNGFTPTTSIPTTDKECEARLPSRVGI